MTVPIFNNPKVLLSRPSFAKAQVACKLDSDFHLSLQDELQSMQARAQYAESRAAVAEAELQALRKVCSGGSIWASLQ